MLSAIDNASSSDFQMQRPIFSSTKRTSPRNAQLYLRSLANLATLRQLMTKVNLLSHEQGRPRLTGRDTMESFSLLFFLKFE